jgi:hypothetical protein
VQGKYVPASEQGISADGLVSRGGLESTLPRAAACNRANQTLSEVAGH